MYGIKNENAIIVIIDDYNDPTRFTNNCLYY